MAKHKARCPKCGSRLLDILETYEECIVYEAGDPGEVVNSESVSGDIIRVEAQCHECGHQWRKRAHQATELMRPGEILPAR